MSSPAAEIPSVGRRNGLSSRRRLYGLAVALLGVPAATAALLPVRGVIGLDSVLLSFVLLSVTASVVGGVAPAVVAALVGFGAANFFFTPPYGTLFVASTGELVDLIVFFAVTVLVGLITDVGARSRVRTERDRSRAEWLAGLETDATDNTSLASVLAEARRAYGADWAGLSAGPLQLAATGARPVDGQVLTASAGEQLELTVIGPERIGVDGGPLQSLAATAGRLWRAERTAQQAVRAEELARIDELRANLLAAVGHDLRGPLATLRTSAATLNDPGLALADEDRSELLAGIEEQVQRLDEIIANLLDLSRLQAGVLSVTIEPVALTTVLGAAHRLGADRVQIIGTDDLPLARADPGLLERVVANLITNADRFEPADAQLQITTTAAHGRVELAVIDHGPGVEAERMNEIFRPFQHFSDRAAGGVGLGLAIARGFTEAMGGTLVPSQTPGGGLTMTVSLEVADAPHSDR